MDHISVAVSDVGRTRDFYAAALAPLGWSPGGFRAGVYAGFHEPGSPALHFHAAEGVSPAHLAFKASGPTAVA